MRDFEYVDKVFCFIAEKEQDNGVACLTCEEKVVLWIWHARGLIENGGIENVLIWEDASVELAEMFDEISLKDLSKVIKKLFSLFPELNPSLNSAKRDKIVSSKASEIKEQLDALTSEFYTSMNCIEIYLAKYIRTTMPNWCNTKK